MHHIKSKSSAHLLRTVYAGCTVYTLLCHVIDRGHSHLQQPEKCPLPSPPRCEAGGLRTSEAPAIPEPRCEGVGRASQCPALSPALRPPPRAPWEAPPESD